MDLELHNKVVLITEGGKGIGAAISRAVFHEGARPVIADRDTEAGKELARELSRGEASSRFVPVERTSVQSCGAAVEQTIEMCGRLDALVNHAGVDDRIGLEQDGPEAYLASLERNLLPYYNMAHYALPHLKRSQGTIVNIATKHAVTGQGGTSLYASAKGAILALTREWAVELLPYGIRVNAIVPADVTIVSKIPYGSRLTAAEEIAAIALFLLSSKAAGHVTGQHMFVHGGYVPRAPAVT